MGILRSLLTLPVTGPLQGALWVAGRIHEAADRELSDPVAIRRALRELEIDLEAGRLDEETFEAAEAVLLERLTRSGR
jgi:cytochrome c-type biogenesis protein CcmH/NrfG